MNGDTTLQRHKCTIIEVDVRAEGVGGTAYEMESSTTNLANGRRPTTRIHRLVH
jgi:hypothetical protein